MPHAATEKRTKIVATLGPASANRETFSKMVQAGLNAVRLNFSHGDHHSHAETVAMVRAVSREMGLSIPIIGDLRGPHIRVGDVENGHVQLSDGQTFILTPQKIVGNAEMVSVSFPNLANDLKIGSQLLIDDGSIQMRVTKLHADGRIEGVIEHGASLSSRRGINVPGVNLSLPPLTQKDLQDIDFAIEQNLDFLALSFVQSASDIQTLKTILAAKDSDIAVIAKIEMSGAVNDIERIVQESDAVMVARGDLALEMSFKEIPIAQKRIIATCRKHAVPVITATQMLESMVSANKPTRAEVTDVANAIFDGTDAVMLSGETAIGQYPVETIATMSRIAARAEAAWRTGEVPRPPEIIPEGNTEQVISYYGAITPQYLKIAAIVTYTRTGSTARRTSRFRPDPPILALTPNPRTCHQLGLCWGVYSETIDDSGSAEGLIDAATAHALRMGKAQPDDYVVVTAGNPNGPPGNTSLISIEQVRQRDA